jgi:hypothetical protein
VKKIIIKVILIFCLTLNSLFLNLFSPKVFAEKINSFNSQIIINKDGTINVTENISYDFEGFEKHGIFRNIPYEKTIDNKKYEINLAIESVTDEKNNPYTFQVNYPTDKVQKKIGDSNKLQIKIGDSNELVTGIRNYVIKYRVDGALGYYQTFDELYWNVTGNDWEIPMSQVSSKIIFNSVDNIENNLNYAVRCFSGPIGSTVSNCQTRTVGNETLISTNNEYTPGEGLTIAYKFPKNLVATLLPIEVLSFRDSFSQSWQSRYNSNPILWSIILLMIGIIIISWYIIYPIKIFVNWWNNGRDQTPLRQGFEGQAGQDKALTAWYDPPKFNKRFLSPEEAGTIVDESVDERDISAMIIFLAQQGHLIIKEYEKEKFKLVKKNSKNTLTNYQKYFLDSVFADSKELDLDTENIADICQKVKEQICESMTDDGLFTKNPNSIRNYYYVIIALGVFTLNITLVISGILFGLNMVRRTETGVKLKFEALSLKNFLNSQDRQLEFQARNQMFFEKLLPYAIAFGVEKVWMKRFEKMHLKNPDWYQSNSTFTNYLFVNSLHSSLSTSIMPDTSSGSSSGFSGGGGGGGGGGSW